MIDLIFNPVIISILCLFVLCLCRVNVLLSIIVSTIVAGVISGMHLTDIMNTFISGMGGNSETALSYILLGAFAAAMNHTGLTDVVSKKIIEFVNGKKRILFTILILIAMASQNIIPIHIAFIPILIPPLLHTMNMLKIDRRAIACILAFGLKTPYIVIPAGFGLIFQNLIAENMAQNGMDIVKSDVWKYNWILGLGMFVGLLVALFVSYRKPRDYDDLSIRENNEETTKLNYKHYITMLAAFVTFGVQILTHSLPLGALCGLGIIFSMGAVKHSKMDKLMDEGIYMMGYVAFIMLVASGFATVLKSTGGIETFVNSVIGLLPESQIVTALIMLIVGLIITMGIGTSFGTIPILAVVFIPVFLKLGFNVAQTAVVLAAAAALGDAGSPASDTTLGPTAGLNVDGQHNHIWDTCVPTFLHYNVALILFALIGVVIFQ
ncbi:MAG: SLC13 family permease [Candidatus Gastranaerophilales bacterium]|nr:SLC13 family permease [Candidatus Gastranaerophilales bacterium]